MATGGSALASARTHLTAALAVLDESASAFPRQGLRQEIAAALAELQQGDASDPYSNVSDTDTRAWLKAGFLEQRSSLGTSDGKQIEQGKPSLKRRDSYCLEDDDLQRALNDESVAAFLAKSGQFDFDALGLMTKKLVSGKLISIFGVHSETRDRIAQSLQDAGKLTGDVKDFQSAFLGFLDRLDELYKPDAVYHGTMHAIDVMSTAMWFLKCPALEAKRSALHMFTVMMAAAIHDVGHPGVNNLFFVKTMDPLALRYNDKSVLENMHAAIAFETMSAQTHCDWLKKFDAASQKQVRSSLIGMVLATDMATHAAMDRNLLTFNLDDENLQFVYETILHCADICNPAKPLMQMLGWTKRITEEFWRQGDREQQLGLEISPMCDREAGMETVPKGQLGFINFVVAPYLTHVMRVIPEAQLALNGLEATKAHWESVQKSEFTYEQIFQDLEKNDEPETVLADVSNNPNAACGVCGCVVA